MPKNRYKRNRKCIIFHSLGEVVEWLNTLVLKTSNRASGSWVQIPPSPPGEISFRYLYCYTSATP